MFGPTGMNVVKVDKNEPLIESGASAVEATAATIKKDQWRLSVPKYLNSFTLRTAKRGMMI